MGLYGSRLVHGAAVPSQRLVIQHHFLVLDPAEGTASTMPTHARDTHHWTHPFFRIWLPNSLPMTTANPSFKRQLTLGMRTTHKKQLEHGSHSDFLPVHINQLD